MLWDRVKDLAYNVVDFIKPVWESNASLFFRGMLCIVMLGPRLAFSDSTMLSLLGVGIIAYGVFEIVRFFGRM